MSDRKRAIRTPSMLPPPYERMVQWQVSRTSPNQQMSSIPRDEGYHLSGHKIRDDASLAERTFSFFFDNVSLLSSPHEAIFSVQD